ncbi:MAG: cytochrome c3 family protein [Epsilonproteobacteria bacterium]|nr:cytochrome c3 family protein [Campylobacterota bacterium]
MKSITRLFIIAITALAAVLFISNAAMAGSSTIVGTVHNLSPTGTGPTGLHATGTQQNEQICVWCHTPHGANVAFQGAPLWNKTTVSTSTFAMYGPTIAGTAKPNAPDPVSLACLSCHDGVDAINRLINQAGSGGYNSAGANVAFGDTSSGTAVLMPSGIDDIGTDLTNDHPVSIIYTPGNASLNPTTTQLTNWITVGATTSPTIENILFDSKIECASCHDPHNNTNGEFLRTSNIGSKLCLTCHNK